MKTTLSWLVLPLISLSETRAVRDQALAHQTEPPAGVFDDFIAGSDEIVTLDSTSGSPAIQTLDYGRSIDGIPSFEVVSAEGDTSAFEITYGENSVALNRYMSDGPLPLAAAMDTYRVNQYNVTGPGRVVNRLIQGAFRYQKLNLSSPGVLKLRGLGVTSKTDNRPLTDLSGFFNSSNTQLNTVWAAGARTVQMTEIPAGSTPEFWEVSSEGSLVKSLAPQTLGSATAAQLMNYYIKFKVKPLVGGFGFLVLGDTLNSGIYFNFEVASRKISAYLGSTPLNKFLKEAILPSNLTVQIDKEYTVSVMVAMTEIEVSINGVSVMQLSQTSSFVGAPGLGTAFGHSAIFRDFAVTNLMGEEVYSNALTDPGFLPDFFMGTNPATVVVDGSRRDRIAYAGDLDIAGGAALASTHNVDSILGSLNLLGSYQATPGFFIPTAKIQQDPLVEGLDVNITGLVGYSFNFMTAVASTYMHTGDIKFASTWAPKLRKMLDWADSQTLDNGLFNISNVAFGGDWNYYDPEQSGVVTKFNMLYAYSLQETQRILADGGIDAGVYQTRLKKLRKDIDSQLWSDDLKAYVLSEGLRTGFSQDSNALAILAGVNIDPSHSSETILSTLSGELMTPKGPYAFSSGAIAAGFQPYISPYATSYHLRAAMFVNDSDVALGLMNSLWAPMADPSNANYTGSFWETLDAEGRPGLGEMTSLCHGWAAGPTAELSRYVLGAQPMEPGWKSFVVTPLTLGLNSANGRVPTMSGDILVDWAFSCSSGLYRMAVEAPAGISGTVRLPRDMRVSIDESTFTVNGEASEGTAFNVTGGTKFVLQQVRKC